MQVRLSSAQLRRELGARNLERAQGIIRCRSQPVRGLGSANPTHNCVHLLSGVCYRSAEGR